MNFNSASNSEERPEEKGVGVGYVTNAMLISSLCDDIDHARGRLTTDAAAVRRALRRMARSCAIAVTGTTRGAAAFAGRMYPMHEDMHAGLGYSRVRYPAA